jgi:hypothetical protein
VGFKELKKVEEVDKLKRVEGRLRRKCRSIKFQKNKSDNQEVSLWI